MKLKNWFAKKKEDFKMWTKKTTDKIWKAVKIYVIILLSISIGMTYTVSYNGYKDMMADYNESMIIIENHFNKKVEKTETVEVEEKEEEETREEISLSPQKTIEDKINIAFKNDPKGVPVMKAESGLNPRAINWNCRYNVNGKMISKSCLPQDRHKAWSVDCGIAQINHKGNVCSEELFNVDRNLEIAGDMFDRRGFEPWVAYKNKSYLKFL